MHIKDLCKESHQIAIDKGWFDSRDLESTDTRLAFCALAHSEISEAVECIRHNDLHMRIENGKPEGAVVELADAVIRICDTCEALGLDLEGAIKIKTEYNAKRPYRHGGKLA